MSEDVTGHVRRPAVDPDHRRHDQLLVARFAAEDADADDLSMAQALVEQCSRCKALAEDLRLVSSSMRRLSQPARPRDFRLTQAQADGLRGGVLARLLRSLAGPGAAVMRPLAGAAMALGITLAVLGVALPLSSATMGSAPALDQGASQREAAAGTALATAAPAAAPIPSPLSQPSQAVASASRATGQVLDLPIATAAPPATGVPIAINNTTSAPPPPPAAGSSLGKSGEQPATQGSPAPTTGPQAFVAPGTPVDRANPVPPTNESMLSGGGSATDDMRQMLIYLGVALVALGLAVLILVTYARRRFRDPLTH